MLKNLYIKNYVLFDQVNIEFNNGFYSVTGDTGAGKSLIIDALAYLSGKRLSENIVRSGEEQAIIEAVFEISNPHAQALLKEEGFDQTEEIIVSRQISADRKSRSKINHRPVTLNFVKEILSYELDIHGQHDQQLLLKTSNHQNLLDGFIKTPYLTELQHSYQTLNKKKAAYEEFKQKSYNEDEIIFFKSQLEEINQIIVSPEEFDRLIAKQNFYNQFEENYQRLKEADMILNHPEGLIDRMYDLENKLQALKDMEDFEELSERIKSSRIELSDIAEELSTKVDIDEYDPFEQEAINEQLQELNRLIRKHGTTLDNVIDKQSQLSRIIEEYEQKDLMLDDLKMAYQDAMNKYDELDKKVSSFRKKNKKILEEEIIRVLKNLMLEDAEFKVSMTRGDMTAYGSDQIEFLISMNPGESLKPIAHVASGGELSRLMLGLKVIFSEINGISTIIFDEIDTGVSGMVARAIGKEMKKLSKNLQVFSVTHLAQVAAYSDHQLFVEKTIKDSTTLTNIKQLEAHERLEVLAYLSFGDVTEQSLKAAKELLIEAQAE